MAKRAFPGAARALADAERRATVIDRWLSGHERSILRLRRQEDPRALVGLAEALVGELAVALAEPVEPGAPPLREAEKGLAFAGGALGMAGASAFDVAAFVFALRDTLAAEAGDEGERAGLGPLFDWFAALALEAYTTSREDALRLKHRDELERGTPVVMIGPELPAAMLVGEPDRSVLEATFGRLLLAVVRVGARAVVIDGAGLARAAEPGVLESLAAFGRHRKVAGRVAAMVSGVPPDAQAAWTDALGPGVAPRMHERFEDAVADALDAAGLALHKKRG